MKFVLHVGTHKTGTTSIQRYLRQNARSVRRAGLWYPDYDLLGKRSQHAHHDIAHALANKSKVLTLADAQSFAQLSRAKAKRGERVLISAEPFYRHTLAMKTSNYWRHKDRYIQRVAEVFGQESEIVFVLRRQDTFAESIYQEHVKATRYQGRFDDFLVDYKHYFAYLKNIEAWQQHFPQIKVLVFEDLCIDNTLELNFLSAIGVHPQSPVVPDSRSNTALHPHLIEFKRMLNGTPMSRASMNAVQKRMVGGPGADVELGPRMSYFKSAEQHAAFLAAFEQDNATIVERHLPSGRPSLFAPASVLKDPPLSTMSEPLYLTLFRRLVLGESA